MAKQDTTEDLVALIDRIKDKTDGDEVSVDDLVEAVGRRAFGPLFIITSLIAVLPTGMIPGMSILTGTIMLILSIQLLFGSDRIWMPDFIAERTMPREKLVSSLDKMRPRAEWVSRFIGPRMSFFLHPPFHQMVALTGVVVSLSMYPLAVVPFGAFPAGLSLLVIGLGLSVRDGLLIAAGIAVGVFGLVVAVFAWPF
ncbi:exopolysaccharide biosynthesis protein [Acuticoccus sp. I52.16.1]|uniref:exopolysaccharide biosynthesis protein n=1 Tax=Acuticoccus sp. I52.16.1 TaxID=2928472 RepID=UPI001FD2FEA7|nr:exopolysaccharide biosynthesis protein [Acuticoccus sp. I52.16.1]UOM32886.1 exopolysaccharide biosynthesis protein [Acuticoccus sp. I52.16.1]